MVTSVSRCKKGNPSTLVVARGNNFSVKLGNESNARTLAELNFKNDEVIKLSKEAEVIIVCSILLIKNAKPIIPTFIFSKVFKGDLVPLLDQHNKLTPRAEEVFVSWLFFYIFNF